MPNWSCIPAISNCAPFGSEKRISKTSVLTYLTAAGKSGGLAARWKGQLSRSSKNLQTNVGLQSTASEPRFVRSLSETGRVKAVHVTLLDSSALMH